MLRRTLPALLVPALLLVACGADEKTTETSDTSDTSDTSAASQADGCETSDELDAVDVSGADGEQPVLDFAQPFAVKVTSCRVLVEGDGDALIEGATANFDFVFVNGRDGSEISSSYGQEPAEIVFNADLLAGVRKGLDGAKAGSRVLVAITPDDGFGPQGDDPTTGLKATDTLLLVIDLHEVRTPLERAEGTPVDPVEGQPTVELDADGVPTITVPQADPPAELIAQPLIEGDGAVVESGQTITVNYTGVLWTTGEVFDSSWESGTPASFSIGTGGVIPGWDKGLVGRTVGSQILLVIPPADGYPEGSGSIPAGATLVFVVDILDAHS
jgi:peptidylprolyl isomerase